MKQKRAFEYTPSWTPGPWRVAPVTVGVCIVDDAGKTIAKAHLRPPKYKRDHERGPNANLIAAAPDLYAALQAAVLELASMGYRNSDVPMVSINAALRKARGES